MAKSTEYQQEKSEREPEDSLPVRDSSSYPAPPDGGWGWIVVFGSFMIHVITDGVTYSLGELFTVLLEKYKSGNGATSVIMSTLPGITLCSGPIASAFVNKYGCRTVTIAGSVISAISILFSMYATSVLELIITMGFGAGIGFGLIYLPAIVSVTCYFEKYRSIATGIAVCGSGIGTAVFAPLLKILLNSKLGIEGTFFVIALLIFTCIFYGILFRPVPDSSSTDYAADVAEKVPISPEMVPLTIVTPAPNDEQTIADTGNQQTNSLHNLSSNELQINKPALFNSQLKLNGVYNSTTSLKSTAGSGIMSKKDVFLYSSSRSIADLGRSNGHLNVSKSKLSKEPTSSNQAQKKRKFTCCPQSKEFESILSEMMDFSVVKEPIFIIFATSNFLTSLGFNIPYIYVPAQAKDKQMDSYLVGFLLSSVGIGNTLGRIMLGYICDKPWVNRLYVYSTCLSVCGIATVMSVLCAEVYSFMVYCFVFGFTTGAYVGLTSVVTADLMGLDKLTNAFGMILLFQGIATLIGPPIAGALCDYTESRTRTHNIAFILAGISVAISGLMLFIIPQLQVCFKKVFKSKKSTTRDTYTIYKKPECNGV